MTIVFHFYKIAEKAVKVLGVLPLKYPSDKNKYIDQWAPELNLITVVDVSSLGSIIISKTRQVMNVFMVLQVKSATFQCNASCTVLDIIFQDFSESPTALLDMAFRQNIYTKESEFQKMIEKLVWYIGFHSRDLKVSTKLT